MINRRTFIKNTSFAITAGLVLPANLMAMPRKKMIGIQLYSLREQIKNDFLGTLDRISEIGFNAVEAAGYSDGKFYGYAPTEYKKII
ncbi:MAG: sugar phosphate isomerase/epimerase, partial [Bacteroidales bacterium]|nr:sugar phosphate isomerase/epimerase [Bacteroidales bacterium]